MEQPADNGIESRVEVELRGLSIYTHHGVTDAEQEIGQRLEFDVSFDVPDCDARPHRPARGHRRLRRGLRHRRPRRDRAQLPHPRAPGPGRRRAADGALRLRIGAGPGRQARAAAAARDPGGRGRGRPGRDGRRRARRTARRRKCPRATGYLGLGSNVGDREAHLRAALELLREHGVEVEAVSSTYETEPVGEVLDQPDFLNAAVRIRTELEPEAAARRLQGIEAERGRALDAPRHSPRPLDVDLLLLGDLELETERLTLPHREVTSRRFVLVPLLELDPDLTLPDGTALADALAALGPGQRVVSAGSL